MGQRSQIYIRCNGNLIVANYYGWNYGIRMVSRAAHLMEQINAMLNEGCYWAFQDRDYIKKFRRFADVNFDMRDILISSDIVKEWYEEFPEESFNRFAFYLQSNNDGKLFIDIRTEEYRNSYGDIVNTHALKYAFTNGRCTEPWSAKQYLDWDYDGNWLKDLDEEELEYTKNNIQTLEEFTVMTSEELLAFCEETEAPVLEEHL